VTLTLTLSALVEDRPCLVSKCAGATLHSSTPPTTTTTIIPTQPSSCSCCGGGMIAREFFHHTRTLHSLSLSLILSCVSCLPHGENDSWRGCFSCFAEDLPLVGEGVFAFCVRFHRVADFVWWCCFKFRDFPITFLFLSFLHRVRLLLSHCLLSLSYYCCCSSFFLSYSLCACLLACLLD